MKCLMKMQKVEERKKRGAQKNQKKKKTRILARLGLSEIKTGWELERVPWHWLHKNIRNVNQFARQD